MKKVFLLILFLIPSLAVLAQNNEKYLDEYVKLGLKNNFGIQSARKSIDVYGAKFGQAESGFFPSLTASTRHTWAGGGRTIEFPLGDMLNKLYEHDGFPDRLPNTKLPFLLPTEQDTKLELVQPIFNWGIYHVYKMAEENINGNNFDVISREQTLALSIREAYYNYIRATKLSDIKKKALQLATENFEISKKLYEADRSPKADVLRAEVLVLTNRQELQSAINMQTLAQNSFNQIINREFDAPVNYDSVSIEELIKTDISQFDYKSGEKEAFSSALELRPELHNLESVGKSLGYATKAVEGEYMPNLTLAATYGSTADVYKFDKDARYWTVSAVASWNLFAGMNTKNKLQELDAQKEALRLTQESTSQMIRLEVKNNLIDLKNNIDIISVAAKSLESAQENYRLTKQRYNEGLTPMINLLDAQTSLSAVEANYVITYYNILTSKARLDKSLGIIDQDKIK